VRVDGKDLSFQIDATLPSTSPSSPPTFLVSSPQRPLKGRGTLGILLFIAGRGRKAYWKRGVGGEGGGAEPIQ